MQNFLEKFDSLAGIETEGRLARGLERIAFAFLILMIVAAPHSIAASQTAWLSGMFAWLVRLFVGPRPKLLRTALDVPLWAFFGWSVVSSAFSYAPDVSFNKLRGAALFLIFYFVVNNLRHRRAACFLALALALSCMVNVVWTPVQRLIGRGVEIRGIAQESPLAKAHFIDGDTLLEANGVKLKTPEDVLREIERAESAKIKFYRPDFEFALDVKRADLLTGTGALERLGIEGWKKSRNWRSAGFFGHYTTYAEVLQLIASIVFGLFIALFLGEKEKRKKAEDETRRRGDEENFEFSGSQTDKDQSSKIEGRFSPFLLVSSSPLLLFCLAAMSLALLLTVTRASQLGFLVAAAAIVFFSGRRKLLLVLALIILPLAVGGLVFLQQSRGVGFFDAKDDSTIYRQTMWRDGARLWTESPRHFAFGVGMDSIKRYWKNWNLYDGGKLPQGHFHSTPLQLLVERGLPALLIWLWILGVYAWTLARHLKSEISNLKFDPAFRISHSAIEKGIVLGALGGLAGFLTSGLVHYNLGDQEVAMVFFIVMGLSVFLCHKRFAE